MRTRTTLLACCCCLLLGYAIAVSLHPAAVSAAPLPQDANKTPADGYTVHVTAPHNVNGHVMGPFHHYCKVHSNDPIIVCQIYDNDDPNSMMTQVEFIEAKKLVRNTITLPTWNKLWHDHAIEIATGRVKVLDMPPDKAKGVADLVATTDGIIYSFDMNGKVPKGTVTMAQAVGHKAMSSAEWKNFEKK